MPIRKLLSWISGGSKPGADAPLIIVITPERPVENELAITKKLFAAGLTRLHLRRHDWNLNAYRDWILEIPKKHHSRIVLHGYPELVHELKLAGFHLQSKHAPTKGRGQHRREVPPEMPISRSCHGYSDLLDGPKNCAYATLGPVFPSISKRDYGPRRTPEEYSAILDYWRSENKSHHPVVGLGGITPENIGMVRRMGFHGAAVIGAIWESEDPAASFRALRAGWIAAGR